MTHCPTCNCRPHEPKLYPVTLYRTCPRHGRVAGRRRATSFADQRRWEVGTAARHSLAGCSFALTTLVEENQP